MESIFISSDESSSNIDSNNTISDSNKSSTSYVPANTFSEEYTNRVTLEGGALLSEENQKKAEIALIKTGEVVIKTGEVLANTGKAVVDATLTPEQQKAVGEVAKKTGEAIANTGKAALDATLTPEQQEAVGDAIQKTGQVASNVANKIISGATNVWKSITTAELTKEEKKALIEKLSQQELIEIILNNCQIPKKNKGDQTQLGGAYNPKKFKIYYEKYLKYKLKYLELKYE
jgi:hypothetical protein